MEDVLMGDAKMHSSPIWLVVAWIQFLKNKMSTIHVGKYIPGNHGSLSDFIKNKMSELQKNPKPSQQKSSWWFQPLLKILVKLDHFPK